MSYISEKGFAGKVMNEALAVDYGRFNKESKGKEVIIQGINNPSPVKHNDLLLCDLVKMIDEASKELLDININLDHVLKDIQKDNVIKGTFDKPCPGQEPGQD